MRRTSMSKEPHHRKDAAAESANANAFVDGQIARQPFPDQAVRSTASSPHPRKRDANRDFKFLPRGSLATDY